MARLFISYSHRDEALLHELQLHLAQLQNEGRIETWHDRRIAAGDQFEDAISENLERADIILLLVSPYFLASKYCYQIEMKLALDRHESKFARVIPVILHPCDWKTAPFAKLSAVPRDGMPVSKFENQHDAFLEIVQAIRAISEEQGGEPIGGTRAAAKMRNPDPKRGVKPTSELARRYHVDIQQDDPNVAWLEGNVHTAKLTDSLPRALQFSKRIGDKSLESWIRLELYGYDKEGGMTDDDEVPEYRAVTGRWIDNHDRVLDLSDYPDLSIINMYRFRFGVAKLEELATRQEMQNIADDQFIQLLREHMHVHVIRFCFSPVELRGVLHSIRNRLAELVLDCIEAIKAK